MKTSKTLIMMMNSLILNPCLFLENAKLFILSKVIIINNSTKVFILFMFTAASEGSIPLEEGEELWLIETDQGDGWTRYILVLSF